MEIKQVGLSDKKLFSINIGKRITKLELHNKEKGTYPAFSANIHTTFGWVDNLLIEDFSRDFVLWGIDGDWMTKFSQKNNPFVPTDHCGYLTCSDPTIDLQYISYILRIEGNAQGFSRSYRASIENIRNLTLPIPIKEDGSFDLEAQKKIAKRYERIEKFQNLLKDYLKTIKNCVVKIEHSKEIQYKSLELKEIFDFYKGNAKYTNEYFLHTNGEYPVYSGATKNLGLVAHIDTYDWDTKGRHWITWTTDGVYAGTVFVRNGKFSMNTHCGLLKPKETIDVNLNMEYISWALNQTLPSYAVGDQNMRVTMGIIKDVLIEIPIKEDGSFDLEEQKRIAEKYQNIESKRSKVIDMLKRVIDTQVKIDLG